MEFICLFCPVFISLIIYLKNNKVENNINIIIYYFINVLIVNFLILLINKFIFQNINYIFTTSFSLKYILLASLLSVMIAKMFNYVKTDNFKKKENKIINFLKKNRYYFLNIIIFLLIILLFFTFDIFTRSSAYNIVDFYDLSEISVNIITLSYCLAIGCFLIILPKKAAKIFLALVYLFGLILCVTNYMLLEIKEQAFRFRELINTQEGFIYFNFIFEKINFRFIAIILFSLVLFIIIFKLLGKKIEIQFSKKNKLKKTGLILSMILFAFGVRILGIQKLGTYDENSFDKLTLPKYHYVNYVDSNKSLLVSGLYEYTFRDICLHLKSKYTAYGSIEEIDDTISKYSVESEDNEMTGKFKNKNVIMVMMESIDKMMINDDIMPTLNKLKKKGLNFSNRYSSNLGTLVTEYTSLNGIISSDSYGDNNNNHAFSLPNLLNNNGYETTFIHENKGVFYNRSQLHKTIGFKNSYFIRDMYEYWDFGNDNALVTSDDIYNLIAPKNNQPFMTFITTISAHGPYANNGYCANLKGDRECLEYLSRKTDDMLKSLLERLKEDNLLDETLIVLFSDHYPYAYNYTEEDLKNYKKLGNDYNMRDLPFIIYGNGITAKNVDEYVSDVDIAPTIMNLLGIEYEPSIYVGKDIFSSTHRNISYSSDYSWYDGKMYSGDKNIDKKSSEYISNSEYVKDMLEMNKMISSNDYYATLKD